MRFDNWRAISPEDIRAEERTCNDHQGNDDCAAAKCGNERANAPADTEQF